MKKTLVTCAAWLLFVTGAAQAIGVNAEAGQHYTNLGVSFGTSSPGLGGSANWAHSDNDGDIAGVGLGLNVPLGPLLATAGGKALYLGPKDGSDGYAVAVGGGLQWQLGTSFALFGEGYYAPDSLSSGVDNYREANAGLRWTLLRPLSVTAGYRYIDMAGKNGHRDNTLADGPYVGARLDF